MKNVSILVSLAVCLLILTGCKKNDDGPDYAQLALGKWINTHTDNAPVLTDASFMMELRTDKVEFYATGSTTDANNKSWTEWDKYIYSVNDDVITIDGTDVLNKVYHMEFKIQTIDAATMTYTTIVFKVDGTNYPDSKLYTMKKITDDYSGQFKGIWYGKCTTVGSADTGYHYWEYLAGGLYNYYYQDANGKWIKKSDNEGRYFLYGNYLATNYTNDLINGGTGHAYECWNFSIAGNSMIWTGLRQNKATVTYEMQKVAAAPNTN